MVRSYGLLSSTEQGRGGRIWPAALSSGRGAAAWAESNGAADTTSAPTTMSALLIFRPLSPESKGDGNNYACVCPRSCSANRDRDRPPQPSGALRRDRGRLPGAGRGREGDDRRQWLEH